MSDLREKILALGVPLTNQIQIERAKTHSITLLESELQGCFIENQLGIVFKVEKEYHLNTIDFTNWDRFQPAVDFFAKWTGYTNIADQSKDQFVFLDTETSGLSIGAGTYTFLIGLGIFKGNSLQLIQLFLDNPIHETSQLLELEKILAKHNTIVTYNGKSFDLPLINSRFISNKLISPLNANSHIDLLALTRRLWKDRITSRTLANIESQVLSVKRSENNVPGWMIPQIYFNFLRFGDTTQLSNVFYHNAMDIFSLALLFLVISELIVNPNTLEMWFPDDIVNLAKVYEDLGLINQAKGLYQIGLGNKLSNQKHLESLYHLASISKRSGDFKTAVPLWQNILRFHQHIPSCVELAKFYEHQERDYDNAILWTKYAVKLIDGEQFGEYEKMIWLANLEHRLNRLKRLKERCI